MGFFKKYYKKLVPKEIDPIRNYVYPEMVEPGIEGITNDMAAARGDALRAELNRPGVGNPPSTSYLPGGDLGFWSAGKTSGGIPVSMIIPPGGFAGAAQQSAAVRHTMAKSNGRKGGKKTQAKRKGSGKKKPAAKRAGSSKRGKPKFGTKAWMAYIRGKRGKGKKK